MTVVEIIKELENRILEYKDENAQLKMKIEELQKEIDRLKKEKRPYVPPVATEVNVDVNEETGEIKVDGEAKFTYPVDFNISSEDSDVDADEKPKRSRRKKNVVE